VFESSVARLTRTLSARRTTVRPATQLASNRVDPAVWDFPARGAHHFHQPSANPPASRARKRGYGLGRRRSRLRRKVESELHIDQNMRDCGDLGSSASRSRRHHADKTRARRGSSEELPLLQARGGPDQPRPRLFETRGRSMIREELRDQAPASPSYLSNSDTGVPVARRFSAHALDLRRSNSKG